MKGERPLPLNTLSLLSRVAHDVKRASVRCSCSGAIVSAFDTLDVGIRRRAARVRRRCPPASLTRAAKAGSAAGVLRSDPAQSAERWMFVWRCLVCFPFCVLEPSEFFNSVSAGIRLGHRPARFAMIYPRHDGGLGSVRLTVVTNEQRCGGNHTA
jgi:hypothetical protein